MAQINKPTDYFNTVLYTGNGSTQSITGVGFQPDWLWIKSRTTTDFHGLFDSNRGSTKRLFANDTSAETTQNAGVTSFDSDGFSLGSNLGQNRNSENFVAWNWLANGGTTSSNTDGSITSTVSANTTSGFSIVSFTGDGTDGATVGHGLGVAPDVVIIKSRDAVRNWPTYHRAMGSTNSLKLNLTDAATTSLNPFNGTDPTSSVVELGVSGGANVNGEDKIMYCFAEVKGFSKFGSYTGNGNADGAFVYTGFKPAWVMRKRTDSANSWGMNDNKRDTFNITEELLTADTSNTAGDGTGIDMLSNGFKMRTNGSLHNASGGTYIYMAFAEAPLVGTNNIPATAR